MEHKERIWIYKSMLILVAAIWGSGFIASKIAVNAGATPMFIMALRFLVASIFLTIVFFKKLRDINRHEVIGGIIVGLFLFLAFAFQTYGIKYTTPSKNAFLTGVNVVIVPFIYWVVYKLRPKNKSFLAAVLCIIGIGFLTLESAANINIGDVLSLVCALLFALHIVSNGYFLKKITPIKLTALQMYFAALFSFIGMFFIDDLSILQLNFSMEALAAILYLGIFSTCIAFLLQTIGQSKVNANDAAILLSLEAMFGTFFSVLLLHEHLASKAIIGSILIFSAILTAEIDFKSLFKSKAKSI